ITVNDATNHLTASQTPILVNAAAASQMTITGQYPLSTTGSDPHPFTVTLKDSFGNIAAGYTGTVTLTSSDLNASFVGGSSYMFTATDAVVHTFTATLRTAGTRSITVTDSTNSL